jgi:hypothetical protein
MMSQTIPHRRVDRELDRTLDLNPLPNPVTTMAAGAVVPLGLAAAATLATFRAASERVAVTAWIAVAVVGSASVIAAAAASRRRTRTFHRVR